MQLIGRYKNAGFESVADGVMDFFERRQDLQRPGVAFGPRRRQRGARQGLDRHQSRGAQRF